MINKLKIDRSFCTSMLNDKNSVLITSAIISLGHDLEIIVIAEGVEDKMQFNFLQAHQCDEIQGFLFSKPVAASDMEVLLYKKVLQSSLF